MLRSALFAGFLAAASFAAPAASAAETAIFAGGCFWCVESDFDKVDGVIATTSGYIGGTSDNPTYRNHGRGGHREAVKIEFDPARVSYGALAAIFFRTIDPTDAGGQFCDRGFSYSTAIYALDDKQAKAAGDAKAEAETALGRTIVTPVETATTFWRAEDYHQDYYKSQVRQLTRFGYITRAQAYKGYRKACRRDERVRALWGDEAYRGVGGGS